MNKLKSILNLLEPSLRLWINGLDEGEKLKINEIRIRKNRPLCVTVSGKAFYIGKSSKLMETPTNAYICSDMQVEESFLGLTCHSVYAYEDQISQGYISLPFGCRAGISGSLVKDKEEYRLNGIFSICIRIAAEYKGCADKLLPYLYKNGQVLSGLIISPPCGGKTTMLREIARSLSQRGERVAVVDERGEIAGLYKGVPYMDVGDNTDILSGVKKEDGIIMACRSLSPNVIIFDEIGTVAEASAVRDALNCGVSVIMSVHSQSIGQAFLKRQVSLLLEAGVLDLMVLLEGPPFYGATKEIFYIKDDKNESIYNDNSVFRYGYSGISKGV